MVVGGKRVASASFSIHASDGSGVYTLTTATLDVTVVKHYPLSPALSFINSDLRLIISPLRAVVFLICKCGGKSL